MVLLIEVLQRVYDIRDFLLFLVDEVTAIIDIIQEAESLNDGVFKFGPAGRAVDVIRCLGILSIPIISLKLANSAL